LICRLALNKTAKKTDKQSDNETLKQTVNQIDNKTSNESKKNQALLLNVIFIGEGSSFYKGIV
jgi:hypothetical protein